MRSYVNAVRGRLCPTKGEGTQKAQNRTQEAQEN
jgi:hypothetical protein